MNDTPLVTVLMAVYNGERYLNEAIDSILAQTFTDFEFLILDDASTDRTPEILCSYDDPRIRIITNEKNLGLTKSLNKGLALAKGMYIARMDADDISMPERFQKQIEYLESHPNVGLLGCSRSLINESDQQIGISEAPSGNIAVHFMCHGTVCIPKKVFDTIGNYRDIFEYAQDYDLFLRIAETYEVINLQDILYSLRLHKGSISSKRKLQQDLYAFLAIKMKEEREKYGKDSLFQVDQNKALEIKKQVFNASRLEKRKLISKNYLYWGKAAFSLGDSKISQKNAIRAISRQVSNIQAWDLLKCILVRRIKDSVSRIL